MRRESAYRLREKPGAGEFAAAWDGILGVPAAVQPPPRKVTLDALLWRIEQGRYRPLLRGGRYVATIWKPDNRALLAALGRLDRMLPPEGEGGQAPEGHGK